MSLATLRPTVKRYVRDTGAVIDDPAGYDAHIRAAVTAYSRKRPRRVVEDIDATGAFTATGPVEVEMVPHGPPMPDPNKGYWLWPPRTA